MIGVMATWTLQLKYLCKAMVLGPRGSPGLETHDFDLNQNRCVENSGSLWVYLENVGLLFG